jgi:hypothetical protein
LHTERNFRGLSFLARPLVRPDVECVARTLAGSGLRQVLSAQGRGTVGAKNAERQVLSAQGRGTVGAKNAESR